MKFLKLVNEDLKVISNREEVYCRLKTFYSNVKANNLYNFFVMVKTDGYDTVKMRMSKSSFYRNVAELKKCNIDFSQKFEIREENNIIDFNFLEWKEVV